MKWYIRVMRIFSTVCWVTVILRNDDMRLYAAIMGTYFSLTADMAQTRLDIAEARKEAAK
jgi:hypothetical protein